MRHHALTAACLLAVLALAAAHVHVSDKLSRGQNLRHAIAPLQTDGNVGGPAFPQLAVEKVGLPTSTCKILLITLVFLCCCGGSLVPTLAAINPCLVSLPTIINLSIIFYLMLSGSLAELFAGKLTGPCWWVCAIALLQLVCMGVGTCIFCACFGAAAALTPMVMEKISNQAIQQVRAEFDKMERELPEDQRDYYTSGEFKILCDGMFDIADADKNGSLSMDELRKPILEKYGENVQADSTFVLAFDKNRNTTVERDEFREMVKYFELKKARKEEADL